MQRFTIPTAFAPGFRTATHRASRTRVMAALLGIIAAIVWAQAAAALCLPSNYRFSYHDYYGGAFLARERQKICDYMPAEAIAEWDRALAALREKAVAEVGEEEVAKSEKYSSVMGDHGLVPAAKRCMLGRPGETARTALTTQLLAFTKVAPYPIVSGEVCSWPIRGGADGVRHIAQIAEFNATLGVEERCRTINADLRKRYAAMLAEYAGKLEGVTDEHKTFLVAAAKWRPWLNANKHLSCDAHDRGQPLRVLKTLVGILKPADQSVLERRISVEMERYRLVSAASAERRWRQKAKLCPLPSSAPILAKLGDGHALERSAKAEFDSALLNRAIEAPLPIEKIDPTRCQLSDVNAFAGLLEFLTAYGTKLPQLTWKEFEAAKPSPTLAAFGALGFVELCGAESEEKMQKAREVADAAVEKLLPGDPRRSALESYRADVRNWKNAACEPWLKESGAATVLRYFGRY